jgi:hypothetical protein
MSIRSKTDLGRLGKTWEDGFYLPLVFPNLLMSRRKVWSR